MVFGKKILYSYLCIENQPLEKMNIRLKEFRLANEISQADVAKVLGLSQSALSRTEALGRDLSDIQIGKMCEAFGREEVMKFVGNPALPEVNYPKAENSLSEAFIMLSDTVKTQSRTIEAQQTTIEEQRREIKELQEALAYYRQTDKK